MHEHPHASTAVALIGPANCVAVTGLPWRRVRDAAVRHGIRRVRLGRATLVPLAELLAALAREGDAPADAADPTDPRATVLAALGRKTA